VVLADPHRYVGGFQGLVHDTGHNVPGTGVHDDRDRTEDVNGDPVPVRLTRVEPQQHQCRHQRECREPSQQPCSHAYPAPAAMPHERNATPGPFRERYRSARNPQPRSRSPQRPCGLAAHGHRLCRRDQLRCPRRSAGSSAAGRGSGGRDSGCHPNRGHRLSDQLSCIRYRPGRSVVNDGCPASVLGQQSRVSVRPLPSGTAFLDSGAS
jgi:hypothetical protein